MDKEHLHFKEFTKEFSAIMRIYREYRLSKIHKPLSESLFF